MRQTSVFIAGLVLALMVAGCSSAPQQVATQSATFSVLPTDGSHAVGSTFAADLVLDSGTTPVDSVDVVVVYDPTLLEVMDADKATEGVQIATGDAFQAYPLNTAKDGEIHLGAASMSSFPTGTQTVGTVTFKVKASGSTQVSYAFEQGSLTDSDVISADAEKPATDILMQVHSATYALTNE